MQICSKWSYKCIRSITLMKLRCTPNSWGDCNPAIGPHTKVWTDFAASRHCTELYVTSHWGFQFCRMNSQMQVSNLVNVAIIAIISLQQITPTYIPIPQLVARSAPNRQLLRHNDKYVSPSFWNPCVFMRATLEFRLQHYFMRQFSKIGGVSWIHARGSIYDT